jgi:hypothetical protein
MFAGRYRGYWINCKRDGPGIQLNANGSIDQGMCVVAVCVCARVSRRVTRSSLPLLCRWREDELIDRMKLDSDHDKQVMPAVHLHVVHFFFKSNTFFYFA